ncbi:MAG TPA: diguanylate cyclase [Casimicrobiaceae bacterium]|nr:diguanylate cyclase [Casimicrobiaceae bacterium]
MKRLSVEYKLLGAFVGGGLMIALAAWFALSSGRGYLEASAQGEHLSDGARAVAAMLDVLQDAEWSYRGYLLTGRADALPAHFAEPDAAQAQLARAQALIGGDADSRAHLARLAQIVPARLAELRANVDTAAKAGDVSAWIAGTLPGSALMTAARVEAHALDERVASRLREARERAHAYGDNLRHAIWLIGVLVIMMFSGAYAVLIGDLRDRRRLLLRLSQAANHDPLTGLPNRRFFGEWLGFAIAHARREVRHVGLLFIDIEGTKAVSDLHGMAAADALLIEIARRFRETAREGDVLARIGEHAFALAIPDVDDPREVAPLAQRLRDALADPARPPLTDTPIGASVGVAFYPDDADDPAGVMAAADAAMYAAKGAGNNRVSFKPLAQAA